METKRKYIVFNRVWLLLGAITIPSALIILFELLKNNQSLMSGWVFGIMAPVEQFSGRVWSLFPFSIAETLPFSFWPAV